jgi:menaquinone-specific isochorismate synthase
MLDPPDLVCNDDLTPPRAIERLIERARESRRATTCRASTCLVSMSLAAPLARAERLLLLRQFPTAILWSTGDDVEHSGVGSARTLSGRGDSRFDAIREGAQRLFQNLDVVSLDGVPAPSPRLFGGFAFNPEEPPSTIWRGFGAALFVLPRIAYTRRAARAWLTLTASEQELASAAGRCRLAFDAGQALEVLSGGGDSRRSRVASAFQSVPRQVEESVTDWSVLVDGICAEITAGRLEKAVAARRVTVRSTHLPPAALVLERLRLAAPACTRFALRVGAETFLGASPEDLVGRAGRHVVTEAVAGSVSTGTQDAEEILLRSDKEGTEHAIVVREIRAALTPLCVGIHQDARSTLRLRHLSHLRTRIVGILKEPCHVLDLAAALHPTPALGGTPRRTALAWLDDHEHADRGFYGGPFGTFDGAGDGHFIVAIRSGLLGTDVAHLFAGAGIVAGSQAAAEWTETRWKLQSMMAAMGVH